MLRRIKYHPAFIRLTNWEYWPIYITNIPVVIFWLIHAIRARDPFFFTAVNPAIPTGGLFGEEKHRIYALMPNHVLPKTLYVSENDVQQGMLSDLVTREGLSFPAVCKPDIGERGMQVHIVNSLTELEVHARKIPGGIIAQEYIPYELELSIMCYRSPYSGKRAITSICRKAFLTATGDGTSTLEQLIDKNPRAILQKPVLAKRMDLQYIPAKDEAVLLEAIGNHCRGTQFLNANDWITPELEESIFKIMDEMPGVHYGRFDLRTSSIDALTEGREFLVMEFNGVGGEPAHIYDPSYPVFRGYRDIWKHWRILYRLAREQKAHGVGTMRLTEGLDSLRKYFSYKKKASLTAGA